MKFRRWIALSALLSVAPSAWASGGDLLSLVWLEAGLFALVLSSVLLLKLSAARALGVFSAYIAGALLGLYLTSDWPYQENLVAINTICVGLPLASWALAVVFLRLRQA
jgi:hypothetical protein